MTTPVDHRWQEMVFAGAAAFAMCALFAATAAVGTRESPAASGSVRLVDQATDLPAPTPSPGAVLAPGGVLAPGVVVPPEAPPLPLVPPGVVLPPLPPELPQMWARALETLASPPPDVPRGLPVQYGQGPQPS